MNEIVKNTDYRNWIGELKTQIQRSQIKAALSVNSQLIMFYWDLGRQIVEKQETAKWGSGFIEQLSKDLRAAFPDMGGFSFTNLQYCRRFYKFYADNIAIFPQVGAELQSIDYQSNTIFPQVEGKFEQNCRRKKN